MVEWNNELETALFIKLPFFNEDNGVFVEGAQLARALESHEKFPRSKVEKNVTCYFEILFRNLTHFLIYYI